MCSHVLSKTTSQSKYKLKRMDDETSSARLAVPWYTASVVKKYDDGMRMPTTADKGPVCSSVSISNAATTPYAPDPVDNMNH